MPVPYLGSLQSVDKVGLTGSTVFILYFILTPNSTILCTVGQWFLLSRVTRLISILNRITPAKKRSKKTVAWLLYILKCSDNTLYTGITNDLPRRLAQHNNGTASRYTRSRLPVQLIYHEKCRGRSSALKKEYELKQLSRKEKEAYIKDYG
jgi:predicted GIY-YIG superfamily endonuclease